MINNRLQQLELLLAESPTDSFLLFAIAKEHEKLKAYEKAKSFYQDLIQKDQEYVGAYYHLGKLYEEEEVFSLALETYNIGIEIAKKINDQHSLQELSTAKINLEMEMI